MEKSSKNGVQSATAKSEAPKNGAVKVDTVKGAMTLATVEVKKVEETPLQVRLRKLVEMNKLTSKRKTLIDAIDKITSFEENSGEEDLISLGAGRNSLEISKPDAVKEVVELLKNNVNRSLQQVDNDLLTASI